MFIRRKRVRQRFYRYQEERYRENGKVKSRSKCLGPWEAVTGIPKIDWKATLRSEPGAREAERGEEQSKEKAPDTKDGGSDGSTPSSGEDE